MTAQQTTREAGRRRETWRIGSVAINVISSGASVLRATFRDDGPGSSTSAWFRALSLIETTRWDDLDGDSVACDMFLFVDHPERFDAQGFCLDYINPAYRKLGDGSADNHPPPVRGAM